jgi:hypothetical protein
MIPELPPWKLKELREKLVELRTQAESVLEAYQQTILELRRDGYYEGDWMYLVDSSNCVYPQYNGSALYPWGPDELMFGNLKLKYVGEPKPPSARSAWSRFAKHFGVPPARLYWNWEHRWVAEFPRPGRASLFVNQNLQQIY